MNEVTDRPERILVFEDNNISEPGFANVEAAIQEYIETKHPKWKGAFGWHKDWRARGVGTIAPSKQFDTTAQKRFEDAYSFCKSESFSGICFFDFELKGVNVESISQWDSIKAELPAELLQFVVQYPGLLLAIATEKNSNATADVWIATSSKVSLEKLRKPLAKVSSRFKEATRGSLAKMSESALTDLLEAAVDGYVDTHSPDEIENVLWPDHAANWFKSSSNEEEETEYVPHNRPGDVVHCAFYKLTEYVKAVAAFGKMIKGSSKEELSGTELSDLSEWTHRGAVYEVLKSFVGNCSPCYGGSYPLKISVFTFSLLAAVGPGPWVNFVPWDDLSSFECSVLGNRKYDCRQAVLAAYRFFRTLQVRKGSGERNTVIVRFSKGQNTEDRMSLAYLDFSFGFSCVEKNGLFLQRLCGGSAEPETMGQLNDSPSAFKDLKMALRNPKLAPQTQVWVFPETVDDIQRTVVRFGVYDIERFKKQ